jgi:hypothetical protein
MHLHSYSGARPLCSGGIKWRTEGTRQHAQPAGRTKTGRQLSFVVREADAAPPNEPPKLALRIPPPSSPRASVSLSRILVPITLVPVKDPNGTRRYEARGALNTNPAALVAQGGRGSVYGSCGGVHSPFSSTRKAAFSRRIRP